MSVLAERSEEVVEELPPQEELPEGLPEEVPDGPEKLLPPPPLEEEAASVESPVEKPQKPKRKLAKPKEQCPRCLRWYAPAVLKYRTHKCNPPVLNGENLVERKPPPEDAPAAQQKEVPAEDLPETKEEELPVPPRDEEPAEEEVAPPPPPPKATRQLSRGQLTLVAPPDLPTHEQVAKWVSFERQSKTERKRARWEAQMFGP